MPATEYLTIEKAARRLGVRGPTLIRWIKDGRFPALRTPGGRYRIAETDLVLALEPAKKAPDARAARP